MTDNGRERESPTVAGYDRLARERDRLETSPWMESGYQRHYVWPGVRTMLPDVDGKRVLDAGCGIGDYAEWFLERGAEVVGVDASSEAITVARRRFGERATFYQGDLTDPLAFASDDEFDLVFSNLVFGHIERWRPALEEFRRVLAPDGAVVLTAIHPIRRYRRHGDELESYYEIDSYLLDWDDTGIFVEQYHRPIEEVVAAFTESGFGIRDFREITPERAYKEENPERYETATTEPDTLCVRAEPTGTD